jgi:hypothetical protein
MADGPPTFEHQDVAEIEGVRLIDINGDSRADWVYVYQDGSTHIFVNQRRTHIDGSRGLRPAWVEAASNHQGFAG